MPVRPVSAPRPAPSSAADASAPKPTSNAVSTRGATDVSLFEGAPVSAPARTPTNAWNSYPHPGDIDRIVSIKDDPTRNYAITQGYHDLSLAMGNLLGTKDASWTAFAVWASNTAGESIRHEMLPKAVVQFLDRDETARGAKTGFERLLGKLRIDPSQFLQNAIDAGNEGLDEARLGIAGGNRHVFNEIGREYSVFLETFDGDTELDPAKLRSYLAHFPPEQAPLRQAFNAYARAMFETDPDKKSELVLLGNLKIGYHEQHALTAHIARGMNAPVKEGFQNLLIKQLETSLSKLPLGGGPFVMRSLKKLGLIDKVLAPMADALARAFRSGVTRHLIELNMPEESVRLGRDLPARGTAFAEELREISNPELRAVLAEIDRTPNSLEGSGANDWLSFEQRMNFIGDLFRSRQQEPSLFDAPFGRRQTYGRPAIA